MKPRPSHQPEIVRRAWDTLDQTPFGYLPLQHGADGFYAFAERSRGSEWLLIATVIAQVNKRFAEST